MCMKGSTSHTYMNCKQHTCKMSKISFNVFCNTDVHYVCVFIEDVVCICLLILLPSKVFYDWKIQQSIDWSHCLLWCKINYNAVFNTCLHELCLYGSFQYFDTCILIWLLLPACHLSRSLCIDSAKFANAD